MDKKSDHLKIITRIEKKLKSWIKQKNDLLKIVQQAKPEIAPRSSLPISIPFKIVQPKETADKTTQTDMNFIEPLSVELVENVPLPNVVEIENPKDNMNNALPDNDASLLNEERNTDLRSLALTTLEQTASDTSSINLIHNNSVAKIPREAMRIANVNSAPFMIGLSNENPTISKKVSDTDKNSDKSNEINIPNNKNQETVEQNEVITISDKTALIDNNVMKDIISSSQNYKQFVNKIFLSIGKLYKSGIFSNNADKLNKISDLFDNIIISYINENSSAQKNHEEASSDNKSNEQEKTNEIELHLQTMKQEDNDDSTTVVSEVVTRVEIDTLPTEQIKPSQIETVQHNKQQPQQKNNNKYNYFDHYNEYLTSNKNSNELMKETRPPCPPSLPNLQQNQAYNNQNYYTNQKCTNKNFRYPYKRSYNRQTPYPRCPQQMNQVPVQPPSQNQQAYTQYPQYINQQSFQMQNQMQAMFAQNTPYHTY